MIDGYDFTGPEISTRNKIDDYLILQASFYGKHHTPAAKAIDQGDALQLIWSHYDWSSLIHSNDGWREREPNQTIKHAEGVYLTLL